MTTSDKGNHRASERSLQPRLISGPRGSRNGGRDPVFGSPLQRNTRREGRSSALGSSKPRLHMTWDMALPHGFPGHPPPSPLHEDGRMELADRRPPRSVWSSQEPRTPDPPFKGTTGISFSLALHQHTRAWRYKTTETKGSQAYRLERKCLKRKFFQQIPQFPRKRVSLCPPRESGLPFTPPPL